MNISEKYQQKVAFVHLMKIEDDYALLLGVDNQAR